MTIIFLSNHLIFKTVFIAWMAKNCLCDKWEYKLMHDLLNDYDSAIRPSTYHKITLNVTFGLALAQLIDVVSKNFNNF